MFRAHGNEIREGAALRELGHWAYSAAATVNEAGNSRQKRSQLLERHPPGEELASALTRHAGTLAVATQPHEALIATEAAFRVVDELDLPQLEGQIAAVPRNRAPRPRRHRGRRTGHPSRPRAGPRTWGPEHRRASATAISAAPCSPIGAGECRRLPRGNRFHQDPGHEWKRQVADGRAHLAAL